MAMPFSRTSFAAGEVSPSVWGRTDLAKYHVGCSTMRNFFVSFRGGAISRAGTKFVGQCWQNANIGTPPPRDIRFQYSINQGYVLEFGEHYMRVKSDGGYVTESNESITGITSQNPGVVTVPGHGYSTGNWVQISGIVGSMSSLNGYSYSITVLDANRFTLANGFGVPIDTSSYAPSFGTGVSARIYTMYPTPWAAVDLPYLKFTQSSDVMSLCCVNQETKTEYPPYDLKRITATNWTLTEVTFESSIAAPVGVSGGTQVSGSWTYQYVVTAVSKTTGDESSTSPILTILNAANNAITSNTLTIQWTPVADAESYNIYRANPSLNSVQVGATFGFVGTSVGIYFTDSNITADFTKVPPTHQDPFARSAISYVTPASLGSGYTQATVGYTINTTTGSGAVLIPVVSNPTTTGTGGIAAVIVSVSGKNYAPTDTITITDSGGGSGAVVALTLGPSSGTYPGGVAYFQQRRYYFSSLNSPDTIWASQPGSFLNMDISIPVVDSDAITATPWSQQVNGIQSMVPMQSGLVVLTGSGAWQITGGSTQTAVTPSNITATAQAYNGVSATVPAFPINYDILYVQAKGSLIRDLAYNFFVNIFTGADKTELANQLFNGYQITQWAYAEEPYRVVWATRNDGALLALTFVKDEDVYGWSRHDTNGLFVSVCSVTEPPVDAVYVIVKRYIQDIGNGTSGWAFYSERFDNRLWLEAEDAWCVDCGLSYPQNSPNATLTPGSATGNQNITAVGIVIGGGSYTAPIANAVDPTGAGSGATFSVSVSSGGIIAITPLTTGSKYSNQTKIVISDATGSGAIVTPVITNITSFIASSAVFSNALGLGTVGDVIRVGGGQATVTSFVSSTEVMANITVDITSVLQFDSRITPIPQGPGTWTIINPVSSVSGLNHLEGMTVSCLADGSVVTQQTVTNGAISLPAPASQIVVGLPFTAQLQTLYIDVPGMNPTIQGRRKQIPALTVRTVASRGVQVGVNQPDASTQPSGANVPWTEMVAIPAGSPLILPGQPIPLYTGDKYVHPPSAWDIPGQVAIQITDPLPAEITMLIPEIVVGDTPSQ